MKKLGERFFILLLCICLFVPHQIVVATGVEEEVEETKEELPDSEEETDSKDDDNKEGGDDPENPDEVKGDGLPNPDAPTEPGEPENPEEPEEIAPGKGFAILKEAFAPMLMSYVPDGDVQPKSGTYGSGSYMLNEEGSDYRFYTEYFVAAKDGKNTKTAGIERKTSIKVYAKAGEYILFGSSVSNSKIDKDNNSTNGITGSDIVITTPGGKKQSFDVLAPAETVDGKGEGYIANPTQEEMGPKVNDSGDEDDPTKYVPLKYEVLADGIYTFEFHSVDGYNRNGQTYPTPKLAGDAWAQGNTTVAAWDITVLGEESAGKWKVKSGRAWADYLALTTGGGYPCKSDLDVYVLTHDGYKYKVNFNQAVPNGFIFFANNTGFMSAVTDEDSHTTTYRPIYHSFYDSDNDLKYMNSEEKIYLHKPDEADTGTQETYKVFFNAPSSDLDGAGIKTSPISNVNITELKFNKDKHENIATTGHGGYFTFKASDEAVLTIRLDLRKAIYDSESTILETYLGSGIVEITTPVVKGENSIYWDGKDTDGFTIPAGIYGDNDVILATEVKHGEIHFPSIDMEGLYGGLKVERVGAGADKYNLYYNNNPLVYGNIEGNGYSKKADGAYYVLSDGTRSYKSSTDNNKKYFTYGSDAVSTLKKDDKDYLAKKFFDANYSLLSADQKAIIDAEFGKEDDTFHFEPVDSSKTTMKFNAEGYVGGGDRSGIDVWTYYTEGVKSDTISFAVMDTTERGLINGKIFYDADVSSSYDIAGGDYLLSGVKVRLIDKDGKPLVHKENLPCFDETGHFIYNKDGTIKHELKDVEFESVTDSTGTYRFTGVPYDSTNGTTYYVQVMLSDVQSEVLRYTCTTSGKVKTLYENNGDHFLEHSIDPDHYGSDGNKIVESTDVTRIYKYKYDRTRIDGSDPNSETETVFDSGNAQSVTLKGGSGSDYVLVETFKMIGFSNTVGPANQRDYKIQKVWGAGTNKISDGLIVELWVWNDAEVHEENEKKTNRRTGALIDTQVLSEDNSWTYTWKNLDNRLQYFVLEYYTKKKTNGEVIYNDKGEATKVLIGGTMPVFDVVPSKYSSEIYGFETDLGDYPETIEYPSPGSGVYKIPIQKFDDGKTHTNSITDKEKLQSVENNARQYDVTYTLTKEDSGKTNAITLTNSQVYDDRAYYVWLDHETKLPDMIAKTYLEGGVRKSHALSLEKDTNFDSVDGEYRIKGLSVSSIDSASGDAEGNATSAFRIKDESDDKNKKHALFKATNHGNYKTGTGTRTYQVKYVVNTSDNKPVSVTTDGAGKLVKYGTSTQVECNAAYTVYTWYMTIHVYDLKPDGVIEYNPKGGPVVLQQALPVGKELKWKLTHDGQNYHSISYTATNDERVTGLLKNDIYRLPLYKDAENPDMGTCADVVGIAHAGSKPIEDESAFSALIFEDTYDSKYGDGSGADGKAIAQGGGGYVEVDLNALRNTRINRTQDHANYAKVTFTPGKNPMARAAAGEEDVFYYKVAVFAEDNTYQNLNYDMDASEGVVMYTYFTMKPKEVEPEDKKKKDKKDKEDSINVVLDPNLDNTQIVKLGASPKTGDENHLVLWFSLVIFAMALIAFGASKRKIKMSKAMTPVICTVGAALLIFAGYMFMSQLNDYLDSLSLYEKTEKKYVSSKEDEKTNEDEEVAEAETDWRDLVNVDLSGLRRENEDIAGWIYFENEDISYPVLHAEDDETYIRKTYTGEASNAGSIFMEGNNSSDFSDAHTIIYGHDMKDHSMFGRLKNYLKDREYIANHEYFQIITEEKKLRYKIFSYKVVADDSDVYTVYKEGSGDFLDFVKNNIQGGNYMSNNENIKSDDHLITLSTCLNDDRLVITAVRCDECSMR